MEASGIILAGGKSSRFRGNKAFIEISSQRLIDRIVTEFQAVFPKIILVTNNPDEYCSMDVDLVADIIPEKGPLSGIHAGLMASPFDLNFIAACDMPFIKRDLVAYLIKRATAGDDAVVPVIRGYPEPLAAVYRKTCISPVADCLTAGKYQVKSFYPLVHIRYVPEKDLLVFGGGKNFFNINTRDDYQIALDMDKGL